MFTNRAPPGGYVSSIAFHPTQPDQVFAGLDDSGGLYQSNDRGLHWALLPTGLQNVSAWDVALGPAMNVITTVDGYGHGVLRSTDGGLTFTAMNNGLTAQMPDRVLKALVIHPINPDILYVGSAAGIFRTDNGGALWTALPFPRTTQVFRLALDMQHPDTLWAGVKGGEIFLSTNGGASWTLMTDINPNNDKDEVWDLVISPSNSAHVVATMGDIAVETRNSGMGWTRVAPAWLDGTHATIGITAAFDPTADATLYLATFRVDHTNIRLKTVNDGVSFQDITTPDPLPTFRLRVNPHDPTHLVAGLGGEGMEVSMDSGQSWQRHQGEPSAAMAPGAFAQSSDGARFYLNGGPSLRRSDDGTQQWQTLASPDFLTWKMAVMPGTPDVVVSAPPYLFASGLSRSTNGGTSFSHVDVGGGHAVMCLLFDPANPQRVLACGFAAMMLPSPRNGIYLSTNGAQAFDPTPVTPAAWYTTVAPLDLAWQPAVPGAVLVATVGGLFVSDAALTLFTPVDALMGNMVQSVAAQGRTWVAGARGSVFVSPDEGTTWNRFAVPDCDVLSVSVDGPRVLAAVSAVDNSFTSLSVPGLYVSPDSGQSWSRVTTNLLPSDQATRILKDATVANRYWMGLYSSAGGLFQVDFP